MPDISQSATCERPPQRIKASNLRRICVSNVKRFQVLVSFGARQIAASESTVVRCEDHFVLRTAIRYSNMDFVTECSSGALPALLKEFVEVTFTLFIVLKIKSDHLGCVLVYEKVDCHRIRKHVAIGANSRASRRLM